MRSDYNGEPIRLLCCETGKGDNCFAEQLSKLLGVNVEAPTETIFALESGGYEIGTKKGLKNGEMKEFPSEQKRGKW